MITVHQDPTHSFWSRIYISGIFLQKHPSSCNQITPTACRNPFTSPFPFFHQWPRIQCTTTSRSLISASKTFSAWMAAICTTRPIYRYKTVLPGENPPKADGLWSCRGCYPCSPAYFFHCHPTLIQNIYLFRLMRHSCSENRNRILTATVSVIYCVSVLSFT